MRPGRRPERDAPTGGGGVNWSERCPACGRRGADGTFTCYFCRCGAFLRDLYVAEHVDPKRAATLGPLEIAAEFRAAGIPMRYARPPNLGRILGAWRGALPIREEE